MLDFPILSIMIFLPLFGCVIIFLIKENINSKNVKYAAFFTSLGTFVLSIFLWINFDSSYYGYQFIQKNQWIEGFNFYYHIGVDGISLFMILLCTFLTPICILASWDNINKKVKEYTFQSIKEYHVIKRVFVKDIQKNHSTEVTFSDILVDSGIDKKLFQEKNLKRTPRD